MFGFGKAKLLGLAGITIVILGLFGGMMYYRAEAATKQATINTLNAKVEILVTESKTLKKHIASIAQRTNDYVDALGTMSEANIKLTKNLQAARTKLAKHNLLRLRNSAHSELVLKTINKSVAKMNKEWMASK